MTPTPSLATRSYRGNLANATAKFQRDAQEMAKSGWFATSQTYAPGSWGCGYFLIALLLCLVLVGFLIFIYMLIVKPEGTLVVTYEYRGTTPEPPTALAPGTAPAVPLPPGPPPAPSAGPTGDGWR